MDDRLRAIADLLLPMSRVSEFDPRHVPAALLRHLFILDVEERAGDVAFRVHLSGTAIDHRFGRSISGELLQPASSYHGPDMMSTFRRCAIEHKPFWLRQNISLGGGYANFVEAIIHYLEPGRIYGALVTGTNDDGARNKGRNRPALEIAEL